MLFFPVYTQKGHTKTQDGKGPRTCPLLLAAHPAWGSGLSQSTQWVRCVPSLAEKCSPRSPPGLVITRPVTSSLPTSKNDLKNWTSASQETLPLLSVTRQYLKTLGHCLSVSTSLGCVSPFAAQGLLGLMEVHPVLGAKEPVA